MTAFEESCQTLWSLLAFVRSPVGLLASVSEDSHSSTLFALSFGLQPSAAWSTDENAPSVDGAPRCNSLTMSYFHTGTRTIIGAEAFHCPVRDGKEWDHLAMVIRHNLSPAALSAATANS